MKGLRTWCVVDESAIGENIRSLRDRRALPSCRFLAVMKADAYGHGAAIAAPAALEAGATDLGVATIEEGEALRSLGIRAPILSLSPVSPEAAPRAVAADLATHLATRETAAALDEAARAAGRAARVHVKVDCGMHRSGIAPGDVAGFLDDLRARPGIAVEGIFAHFASADASDRRPAYETFGRFVELLRYLEMRSLRPPLAHIANSAAAIDMPETALDMIRVGIALYGIYPSHFVGRSVGLRPALSWKARLAEIRTVAAGEPVGYSETWVATRATRIGLITVGYADGYRRLLSNHASVLHRGVRVPVVGRVSMDLTTVDLGTLEAAPGDEVTLLGAEGAAAVTAEDLAHAAATIPYEITTGITSRVPRFSR